MAFAFLPTISGPKLARSNRSAFTPMQQQSLPSLRRQTYRITTLPHACTSAPRTSASPPAASSAPSMRPRTIAIIGKAPARDNIKEVTINVEEIRKGLFGMRANAYWESMGVLPLFFAGFGLTALLIKLLKLKGGELRGGPNAVNRMTVPKTAITSEAEEAELHVFKCGGCGYEMYPARGREFKFFPDSFKCPLCGTPKSEFWDLNDPDDPRNQTDDDEDEGSDSDSNGNATDPQPADTSSGTAVQASGDDGTDPLRKENSTDPQSPPS